MPLSSKLAALGLLLEFCGFLILFVTAEELKGLVVENNQEKMVKMTAFDDTSKKHLLEEMFPYLPSWFISHYARVALAFVLLGVVLQIVAIFVSCYGSSNFSAPLSAFPESSPHLDSLKIPN